MEALKALQGGASPTYEALVRDLLAELPELGALGATPQDARWHGEGSVEEHVKLVLEVLYRELESQPLRGGRRPALVLAALLHDIGKTTRTKIEERAGEQRIVSPGHAGTGRSVLALALAGSAYEVFGAELAEQVPELVGAHHDLLALVRDGAPEHRWLRLAARVDLELLWRLERADIQGRISADREERLVELELFKEEAERQGLWAGVDPHASWRAGLAQVYQNQRGWRHALLIELGLRYRELGAAHCIEEAVAKSWFLREAPVFLVQSGVSGSGKSSAIAAILEAMGDKEKYLRIELDGIREELTGSLSDQSRNREVVEIAKERLKKALRDGQNVVWDATSLRRDFRSQVIAIGRDYKALVGIVAHRLAPAVLRKRNRERAVAIPEGVLEEQVRRFQWPRRREADGVWVWHNGRLSGIAQGCH